MKSTTLKDTIERARDRAHRLQWALVCGRNPAPSDADAPVLMVGKPLLTQLPDLRVGEPRFTRDE